MAELWRKTRGRRGPHPTGRQVVRAALANHGLEGLHDVAFAVHAIAGGEARGGRAGRAAAGKDVVAHVFATGFEQGDDGLA